MLAELKTFITVVEEENFTKAAEKLNLSQPSVSVHIKNLEAYFHTALIARSVKQKKIVITESGKLLYRRSKEMFSIFDTTVEEMKNLSNSLKGHLKIGATLTIGEYILPPFLALFCEKYPDIHIEIVIDNNTEIAAMTKTLKLDLALVEGAIHAGSFDQGYFLEDRLVLVTQKNNKLASGELTYENLAPQNWLARESGSVLRSSLDFFLATHRIVPQHKVVLSSNHALLSAIKGGLGSTMLCYYMVQELKNDPHIAIIDLPADYAHTFSFIVPKDLRVSNVGQVFLQELLLYIKNNHQQD